MTENKEKLNRQTLLLQAHTGVCTTGSFSFCSMRSVVAMAFYCICLYCHGNAKVMTGIGAVSEMGQEHLRRVKQ